MKLKFARTYDDIRKKGYEVEVDKIRFSYDTAGNLKVRVVGEWKNPRWFSIIWFVRWKP